MRRNLWLSGMVLAAVLVTTTVTAQPPTTPPAAPPPQGERPARPGRHPHIHAATRDLERAETQLEKAAHHYDGHRATALELVKRAEPPVVITSSTTRQRSPGVSVNPRRSRITPFSRSVKSARTPSARATSCATRIPPMAGARTVWAPASTNGAASASPSRAACSGYWSTSADCR